MKVSTPAGGLGPIGSVDRGHGVRRRAVRAGARGPGRRRHRDAAPAPDRPLGSPAATVTPAPAAPGRPAPWCTARPWPRCAGATPRARSGATTTTCAWQPTSACQSLSLRRLRPRPPPVGPAAAPALAAPTCPPPPRSGPVAVGRLRSGRTAAGRRFVGRARLGRARGGVVAPRRRLVTSTWPPWAPTMAATMARPRPAPPRARAGRVGPVEALEDVGGLVGLHAGAVVRHSDHGPSVSSTPRCTRRWCPAGCGPARWPAGCRSPGATAWRRP